GDAAALGRDACGGGPAEAGARAGDDCRSPRESCCCGVHGVALAMLCGAGGWAPVDVGRAALPPRRRPPTSARMSDVEHPARLASKRSIAAVRAKDKAAWIALFAEDAVIEDPVGVSPIDP